MTSTTSRSRLTDLTLQGILFSKQWKEIEKLNLLTRIYPNAQ